MAEKLVRNGPGFRIRGEGSQIRVADRSEMSVLLARKLVEEAQEVLALAQRDSMHDDIIEELGDVTEVIRGMRRLLGIRKHDVRAARRAKRRLEGDFSEQLVWKREQV